MTYRVWKARPRTTGSHCVIYVLHLHIQYSIADEDILEIMRSEKSGLKKFSELINLAGLTDYIRSLDSFTMFLPTDDALKASQFEV